MDEEELVHGLVNSLAFEVEAIPEDNVIKFTSTNGTPLNVKVRVRNKDEPRLVQRGIVSVPKLGKHIASLDQIKLISSDQTILSFNVYMETELKKQSPPKNRKHGFNFFKLGGCLGTSYDEDEGPYLPGPSSKKALRSRTSSKSDSDIHAENMGIAEKTKLNLETSNAATRAQKKLFGKCKPGGCLDPPFGEDKEPFRPANTQSHMKPKHAVKVKDNKEGQSINTSGVEPGKSSKEPTKLFKNEPNKSVIESKPLLDIYARPLSLEHSSTSNYLNATVTHPSKMSSSKTLAAGKNTSITYDNDSLRQNYQYPEKYYVPPKDILQNKEEERRYSRERSNDRIRPTTSRQEIEHQTSDTPHIFDVPNKIYPENTDARSPTKLTKHKGKHNTEMIKQTLTDLTSNDVDNAQKSSEDHRKNSKTLDTQKAQITSVSRETPLHDENYPQKKNDFEIVIAENKLEEKPLGDRSDGPDNKYLSKDMRNKNKVKNEEPMQAAFISEPINTIKPESGKITDLYFGPTVVSTQEEVKILRSVSSSDTRKCPEIDYSTSNLNSILDNKPIKSSDNIKSYTDSQLASNELKNQTKLSMAVRLPSLDKDLGLDDTNENNTTPVARLKDNPENENRDSNIYPDTANTTKNSPIRQLSQEQANQIQNLKKENQHEGDSHQLIKGVAYEKIEELLKTDETLNKQKKGKKNIQEEQMEDPQSNKLEVDGTQQVSDDFKDIEGSARKILQDLDLKIINDENLHNVVSVETCDETLKAKLSDLNSKNNDSNNGWKTNKIDTDSITNQNILQNSAPSETLHKIVLNEEYMKSNENVETDIVLNGTAELGVSEIYIHDTKKNNKNNTNITDLKGIRPDKNDENFSSAKPNRPEHIARAISDDLLKFDKQLRNKYPESNVSGSQAINIRNDFTLDDKKQPTTASIVHDDCSEHQPIEKSIKNLELDLTQNLSHDGILKANKELDSDNLKTNNLNYEENKKDIVKVNVLDNDKVMIENPSVQDRKKNLKINNQDKIPSAILQKTPLIRTDDSDLRNDDINVIKPFKRNTFTIVASSTSLEKQDEIISTQQTDPITDEHLNGKQNEKFVPNDQTTTESESFVHNNEQRNNAFVVGSKQETTTANPFVNISIPSEASLKIYDRRIESENNSGIPGLENQIVPRNQNTENFAVNLDTNNHDKIRGNDYHKSSLSSDIALNDVKIIDTRIRQSQEENDDTIHNKEKLILKNIPVDLAKQISELQDRSENDFENIDIEPNLEVTPHNSEHFQNSLIDDKLIKTAVDNKTIQITNLPSLNNTDDLFYKEISNVPVNTEKLENEGTEEFSPAKFARGVNDNAHVKPKPSPIDDKSDTNSARAAMEYGSRLLKMSEGKLDNELNDVTNSRSNILRSSVAGEPDEHTFELFSAQKVIHTNDQNPPMVDEGGNIKKISEFGSDRNVSNVNNKNLLVPEDSTTHYDENETDTIIDEDNNLKKISDPGAAGSLNTITDKLSLLPSDNEYYSEIDQSNMSDTRISEYNALQKISESESVESFNKNIYKTPMQSKNNSTFYSEYDNFPKIYDNGDVKKTSEPADEERIFNENISKDLLLAKHGITRNIEQHDAINIFEDDALINLSDFNLVGNFTEDKDKKPPIQENNAKYYSEHAPSSKAPISTYELAHIDRPGTKIHLDTITGKPPSEQSESVILKQDGKRMKTYNQIENKPNRADAEGTISSPIQRTKSEEIFLNLALQSYVNNNNERVVQTLNSLIEPVRYQNDNITRVHSLIRHGREIRVPVDVDNDLSLKFVSKTNRLPRDLNADQKSSKKIRISKNLSEHAHHRLEDVDESLGFIYERKLIPLHDIIRNLTEEINTLTTQQELLKVKLRRTKKTKSLRLIPVSKQCGCGRV